MALELIEHIETNNVWSVSITNIPQDGTALLIKTSLRDNQGGGAPEASAYLRVNNDSSTNYYWARNYLGYGSDHYQNSTSQSAFEFDIAGSAMNAGVFATGTWMIENYTGSNQKNIIHRATMQNESNSTSRTNFYTFCWYNTSAITSLLFYRQGTPAGGYSFDTGGTITIYKYVQ